MDVVASTEQSLPEGTVPSRDGLSEAEAGARLPPAGGAAPPKSLAP